MGFVSTFTRRAGLTTVAAVLLAWPAAAVADDHAAFFGAWGSPSQCARALLIPDGSVAAEPFVIGPQWLKHGRIWCSLSWFSVEPRENGLFSGAYAQCGEDSVRAYRLGMEIVGDRLMLRWDFRLVGPLSRCPGS